MSDHSRNKDKPILARKVRGVVKWFNVKSGYGFVTRLDNSEDIFIHQSAIVRNNPTKFQRSVGEDEEVEFDVVDGEKGLEAVNVTGPNGRPVEGSSYATEKRDRYDDDGGSFRRGGMGGYRDDLGGSRMSRGGGGMRFGDTRGPRGPRFDDMGDRGARYEEFDRRPRYDDMGGRPSRGYGRGGGGMFHDDRGYGGGAGSELRDRDRSAGRGYSSRRRID